KMQQSQNTPSDTIDFQEVPCGVQDTLLPDNVVIKLISNSRLRARIQGPSTCPTCLASLFGGKQCCKLALLPAFLSAINLWMFAKESMDWPLIAGINWTKIPFKELSLRQDFYRKPSIRMQHRIKICHVANLTIVVHH